VKLTGTFVERRRRRGILDKNDTKSGSSLAQTKALRVFLMKPSKKLSDVSSFIESLDIFLSIIDSVLMIARQAPVRIDYRDKMSEQNFRRIIFRH
jgi:hypothetical protein